MTVYIDLIFLENVFMNSIIIYATSLVLKKEIKILRILLASFIGATYACIQYICKMEIYSNFFLKLLLSIVIVYISFNNKKMKYFFREVIIFYLTSFTFGGVTFALLYFINPREVLFKNGTLVGTYPLKMILIGGVIGFIIIITSFRSIKNKIERKDMFCNVKIIFNRKKVSIKAIIDTGNFLKEPLTGKPVVIVEKDVLKECFCEEILEHLEDIVNGKKSVPEKYVSRICLIPFTALGTKKGLILGIKPDKFCIQYQEKNVENNNIIIGIYENKLSKSNKYNALVGLEIISKID